MIDRKTNLTGWLVEEREGSVWESSNSRIPTKFQRGKLADLLTDVYSTTVEVGLFTKMIIVGLVAVRSKN